MNLRLPAKTSKRKNAPLCRVSSCLHRQTPRSTSTTSERRASAARAALSCATSRTASTFFGRCGLSITPAGSPPYKGGVDAFRGSGGSFPNSPPYKGGVDALGGRGGSFSNQQASQAERLCQRCREAYPPHIKFCGKCGLT